MPNNHIPQKTMNITNDPNIKPTKVQVLSQSKLGLLHSKIFNGPGVRRAIDSKGKKYWVPYRGKLEVEFEANMYKLGLGAIPYPFVQTYAVVPIKNNSKAA